MLEPGGRKAKSGGKSGGNRNNALQQPLKPSSELAAITGSGNIARSDVVSKIWDYIKKNKLQNPSNKREIMADAKLKPIFGGKDRVSMFEMNKHLSKHLSKP
jgi:chromatin remodeling complex protein RSC6